MRTTLSMIMAGFLAACSGGEEKQGYYRGYEMPRYGVLKKEGAYELRRYEPMLMAEVRTQGSRSEAVGEGFKILAAYIFGENQGSRKLDMTTPVTQSGSGETIAMTSPVSQNWDDGSWRVQFMMPSQYTLATLPKTRDERIRFFETKPQKRVTVRFAGVMSESTIAKRLEDLRAYAAEQKLTVSGAPLLAYYDDPFTMPWNRRNEIQLIVE